MLYRIAPARRSYNGFFVVVLVGLYPAMHVNADEIRPALLDIKEQNTGLFAVTWKVPTRGDRVLAITPQLPDSLELLGSPPCRTFRVPASNTRRTRITASR